MKKILLLLGLSISLLAYSDYDLDGVDDKLDMCPNTQFSDLIDMNGCSVKSLVSPHHFDIIYGISISELESVQTTSQSLQVDYYYKSFSISAASSNYDSDIDGGSGDSFIGTNYKLKFNKLNILFGLGVVIPTYKTDLNNNNADYTSSLSVSYSLKKMSLFSGYSFTKINDDDIVETVDTVATTYQNSSSYNIGVGFYPSSKIYASGSYRNSDSIYKYTDDGKTLSVFTSYSITSNWFANLSYAHGLNDTASDYYTSLRLGYYF